MKKLKFLVLTHIVEPLQDTGYVRLKKTLQYYSKVKQEKNAELYSMVSKKGFALIVDVDTHDELIDILHKSPTVQDEEYRVFPLGSVEGETETADAIDWETLSD